MGIGGRAYAHATTIHSTSMQRPQDVTAHQLHDLSAALEGTTRAYLHVTLVRD
jgi:hypothetical protein